VDMNEDMKLEGTVRDAFEEGVSLTATLRRKILEEAAAEVRRRRMCRLFGRWSAPSLLAASIGVSLAFLAVFWGSASGSRNEMAEAIGLLCEIDGMEGDELSANSPGDLLLAWQEAPCADLFL